MEEPIVEMWPFQTKINSSLKSGKFGTIFHKNPFIMGRTGFFLLGKWRKIAP
jgi:hypothetical protein